MNDPIRRVAIVITLCASSACAIGPKYVQPEVPSSPVFREPPPAGWKVADPIDSIPRGACIDGGVASDARATSVPRCRDKKALRSTPRCACIDGGIQHSIVTGLFTLQAQVTLGPKERRI